MAIHCSRYINYSTVSALNKVCPITFPWVSQKLIEAVATGVFKPAENSQIIRQMNAWLFIAHDVRTDISGGQVCFLGANEAHLFNIKILNASYCYIPHYQSTSVGCKADQSNGSCYMNTLACFQYDYRQVKLKVTKPGSHLQFPSIIKQILLLMPAPDCFELNNRKNAETKGLNEGNDFCYTATPKHVYKPAAQPTCFLLLTSGPFKFKAVAVTLPFGLIDTVVLNFEVFKLWKIDTWFKIVLLAFLLILFYAIYLVKHLKKLAVKKATLEQQHALRLERQRISSEIHDDIGSEIFAIQLFVDIASKKAANSRDIGELKLMINNLSDKIRDIVWTFNIENDDLENLIYFVQFQLMKMFEHTDVVLEFSVPEDMRKLAVNSQTRRNIYLIIKELAHNALKHAMASQVNFDTRLNKNEIVFVIKDNGLGFVFKAAPISGMGLKNVKSRLATLNGKLIIEHNKGTTIAVHIPLAAIAAQ